MERITPVGVRNATKLAAAVLAAALSAMPICSFAQPAGDAQKAQVDQQAAALFEQGKLSFDQGNFERSIRKFRQYADTYPQRKEAALARLLLGISIAEYQNPDWSQVADQLQQALGASELPEKARGHYWLGVALRVTGQHQLDARNGAPQQQKEQTTKAIERITQAAGQFAAADAAYTASVNPLPGADVKELPAALEQAARAKVEKADALIKAGWFKEAAEAAKPLVADALWSKSKNRAAGLLCYGIAQFEQKDFPGAFTSLAQLAPFDQPAIGLHARYLLGRIKQETGEKPEAVLDYDAVLKAFPTQRQAAQQSLQNPETWKGKATDRLRVEAIVRSVPDYVLQSAYQSGLIQMEYGQFADAMPRFKLFREQAAKHELAPQAQLNQGICYAMLKAPETGNTLSPLAEHPALGDQATWWIGRYHRITADPSNGAAAQNQYKNAAQFFVRAAEKAKALGATDRRAEMLMDYADTQVLMKQFAEAASVYKPIAEDASNADRAQVAHEKLAMCLVKANDYAGAEAASAKFLEKYPRSMLRANIMFWQAEASYRQALELAKKPETAEQANKLHEQTAARYQAIVDKYPESANASAARYGLGMSFYRQGQWAKAARQFTGVLDAERIGDMAMTSYYQADSVIKTLPASADDALSAGRLAKSLEEVTGLLGAFVGSNMDVPEMPDAMLKLADAYTRSAELVADQQVKTQNFQGARETYDKLLQRYPKHPAFAQAVMDRARLLAAMGDMGGAINELNRFRNEPQLTGSTVAPPALVRLSEMMVQQGRAVDAAVMMDKARKDYEPNLLKDPAKAETVAGLRLSHALALRHSGKSKEALTLLEGILKDYANSPAAAEASLASIQVRQLTALGELKSARQAVGQVPLDKPVDDKLITAREAAMKQARDIADALSKHAERIAANAEGSDLHVRTLRDAAVTWRAVADAEIEILARKQAGDSLAKLKARIARDPSRGNSVPRAPQIKLASLPMQPAEKTAREFYNKALEANADSPICNELRLDLAEMCFNRGEADAAMQLIAGAIDKNPPTPQLEQLRIRLGNCHLLKNNADGAIEQAMLLLADTNSAIRPAAYLLKGKAHMLQKDWGQAVTVLTRYRAGAEKYVNAGPVTEEGLFRLAESYAAAGSFEEARLTFEHLIQRFGGGRFVGDAWLGMGAALQQMKRFDEAVNAYTQATRAPNGDAAAKAQYRIGLCRVEQKRWQDAVKELLIVPVTYDHDESSANSNITAAKALVELKKPAEAKQLLQQVVAEHPNTQWAAEAQKQLAQIQ